MNTDRAVRQLRRPLWTWALVLSPVASLFVATAIGGVTGVYDWRLVTATLVAGLALGIAGLRATWSGRRRSFVWLLRFSVSVVLILIRGRRPCVTPSIGASEG
jgi:hypothetical protein